MMNGKKSTLSKRYQQSYETKDSGGSSKKGVMDWKKIDSDIVFFSPQEGKNRINIIPYEIKTKNHPLVKRGEFEIGDKDYVMDIFVHRGIGPTEASVLCLKNTYGKPCPVCEQMALLNKQGKEEESKALKAQRRVFYNIQDLRDEGKVKIFEASHYLFEKELIDEARDDEEGGFIDFADPEEGKEIKFRASETSFGGRKYKEFKSFSFEERDEPLEDDVLEQAISFDEIMNVPTYEEVEKILFGTDDDEEEKPSKKKSDDEQEDEETPKQSKKRPADDDDDDDEKSVKKSKVIEEDDEEEKPVKKSKVIDEDDKDDEDDSRKSKKQDDEDDEQEETSKKSCDENCGKCPFGHRFGVDVDDKPECDDCDVWDKCVKASR